MPVGPRSGPDCAVGPRSGPDCAVGPRSGRDCAVTRSFALQGGILSNTGGKDGPGAFREDSGSYLFSFSSTAEGFHQGSTRVPPGFHQGSTRVPPGFHMLLGISPELIFFEDITFVFGVIKVRNWLVVSLQPAPKGGWLTLRKIMDLFHERTRLP